MTAVVCPPPHASCCVGKRVLLLLPASAGSRGAPLLGTQHLWPSPVSQSLTDLLRARVVCLRARWCPVSLAVSKKPAEAHPRLPLPLTLPTCLAAHCFTDCLPPSSQHAAGPAHTTCLQHVLLVQVGRYGYPSAVLHTVIASTWRLSALSSSLLYGALTVVWGAWMHMRACGRSRGHREGACINNVQPTFMITRNRRS